jgi:ribokinase
MKIINFGSLNIDNVYNVQEFVKPGQTIFSNSFQVAAGGKGLNQSIAAARAGAPVIHAGCIGQNGAFLADLMQEAGVDISALLTLDAPNGHTVIEVNAAGQNRIIVYGGTNQMLTEDYLDTVLSKAEPGDLALLQNETNLIASILQKSHEKGMKIVFNPSPMPKDLASLPLHLVDYFMINELEAAQLADLPADTPYESILDCLAKKYPHAAIVMTLGHNGVLFSQEDTRLSHPIFPVEAVDTTAAGDTFCGYFLAAICRNAPIETALKEASAASAIAVSRPNAAPSIPLYEEVETFLRSF